MSNIYFSIIIPVVESTAHLLPLTFEIIQRQKPIFEVVIADGTHRGISLKGISFPVRRVVVPSHHPSALLNAGAAAAQGLYLHFLQPGEFYMSTTSLELVEEFLRAEGEPDVLSCGYFVRHRFEPPTTIMEPLTEEDLRRARVAATLHPYWVRRDALQRVGEFSKAYEARAGLDILCHFFAQPQLRTAHLRRIITDYEYRRPSKRRVLQEFSETASISLKHYGIHFHLFSWLWNSYLRLVRWGRKMLKRAFWQQDAFN